MAGMTDHIAAMMGQAFRGTDELAILLGGRLMGASIDAGEQHYLVLHMEGHLGPFNVVLVALGDCCSESWFYEVTGLSDLYGHIITGGEAFPGVDVDDGQSRQDSDQLYKITLESAGVGRGDIIFRNSSNGYYGGWIEVVESVPAGKVMLAITGDYCATAGMAS